VKAFHLKADLTSISKHTVLILIVRISISVQPDHPSGDVAALIKQNPTLQTPSMVSSLATCSRCIEELQQLLAKIAVDGPGSKWKKLRKSFKQC
jgi:hypothetical protein